VNLSELWQIPFFIYLSNLTFIEGKMSNLENTTELEMNKKVVSDEVPVIELTGRIIDADVKIFQKKLDHFYNEMYPRIILEVTNATFIDSHGLGTIVYYHTLMHNEQRELIIVNANKNTESYLNQLFEMTNLNKVLKIIDQL
jgi:anti-anti-sigma factor